MKSPQLRLRQARAWTALALFLSLLLACRHAGSEQLTGRVLARGGELGDVDVEQTNVTVTSEAVTVWGVLEVPDGSRLQAAYAGVDAITRAELLKVLRVRVAGVVASVESTKPEEKAAFEHTFEAVEGAIRHAGTPVHGWQRVLRGDAVHLRIWARLTVPRGELERSLGDARAKGDVALPANIIDELASSP